jgi:hypothetical protein
VATGQPEGFPGYGGPQAPIDLTGDSDSDLGI